jgi:NAD(P)H dehydrogenase (quinone)
MIVVTGASGKLGRLIVQKLAERVSAKSIVAVTRDLNSIAALAEMGIQLRFGDFNDPESLQTAFAGAAQILLVSSNAAATGGDPLSQHRAAIEAGKAAGATRIVYTSHMAASATSKFPPMRDHHATEQMLRESGVEWTALRNGFYAASALNLIGDLSTNNIIETTATGDIAWTTHDDLAEAAAVILAEPGQFEGATPPLTARAALGFSALADIAADLLNIPVSHVTLSEDEMRQKMRARGMPEGAARTVLGLYSASNDGEFGEIDRALEMLLGRAPQTMREFMATQLVFQAAENV